MMRIMLALVCVCIAADLYGKADQRLQVHENFTVTINESFAASAFLFETWRDDISDHFYYEAMAGFLYKTPISWISLGPFYKQAYMQTPSGQWQSEKAPNVFVIFNYVFRNIFPIPLGVFNLSRHEYRFTREWHNYRMRNYFSIYIPLELLRPYAAWELFYCGELKRFNYTHMQFGLSKLFLSHIMPSIYYRIGFTNDGKKFENTDNTLGVEISFNY